MNRELARALTAEPSSTSQVYERAFGVPLSPRNNKKRQQVLASLRALERRGIAASEPMQNGGRLWTRSVADTGERS